MKGEQLHLEQPELGVDLLPLDQKAREGEHQEVKMVVGHCLKDGVSSFR